MSLKYSLKNRRKLLALLAISLFIGSIYTPLFLFSQTSNNYLTNLLILDGKTKPPINHNLQKQGQSWLSGWGYRKIHTIVGSTVGAQTNYQMKITVYYGYGTDNGEHVYCNGHCKTDFSDIRFTTSNRVTELDYWIEDKTDSDKATFWVEIDHIPASPESVDIYIYYGNSAASTTSNGDNTFIFFDDFTGSSIDTDKWGGHISGFTVSDSVAQTSTPAQQLYSVQSGSTSLVDYAVEARVKIDSGAKGHVGGRGNNQITHYTRTAYDINYRYPESDLRLRKFLDGDTILDSTSYTHSSVWCRARIFMHGTSISGDFDGSGTLSVTDSDLSSGRVRIGSDGITSGYWYIDWVFARNYADPEPSHESWGEEQVPEIFQPWLSGWSYRKSHTIIGSTAGAQTNYQMKIVVHYGNGTDSGENVYFNAHCKNDFGDIRFTKSDGTTLLDYWMEEKTDGYKATFWVEIDSIPVSPDTVDIYIYYGKSDANTTSSGANTFLFFDDFEDNCLDNDKWSYHDGEWSEQNQRLEYSGTGTSRIESSYITNNNVPVVIELKGYWESGTYWNHDILVHFGDADNYQSTYLDENNEQFMMGKRVGGVSSIISSTPFTYSQDTWYDIKSVIKGSQNFESHIDSTSLSGSYTERSSGRFIIHAAGSLSVTCYYDNVKIRKYADPDPTHGSWGSEEQRVITIELGAGQNQQINLSAEFGVEFSLNLTNPVLLNITRPTGSVGGVAPPGLAFLGIFVSIEVNDTTAIDGITIIIHYTDQQIAELGLDESSLAMWYWNVSSGIWVLLPSTVDAGNNIVFAHTDHLTYFAVMGKLLGPPTPPYPMFMLLFQLTQSELSPLIFLALGLVLVAVLAVMGVIILKSREEMAPEITAPTPIAGRIRCPYCGSEILEDHNFCMFCGRARPKR